MKINLENIQDISHFGLKILCDGHVTVQGMLNDNRLKMRLFLCDAYVTEQKVKISSSINFLFDCITYCTTKNVIYNSFSMRCLFNGYLTEFTSYAHSSNRAYLIGGSSMGLKTTLFALLSGTSSGDEYLNELHFTAIGGLGKLFHSFGDQTEEIINELNEALVA